MKQYNDIKSKYPDTILLFRVGDFYETFGEDAILASKIGVEVHAGHGLDFKSTKILTKINEIVEFNIGHFIIGESIFYGLPFVIKKFKRIIKN